MPINVAISGLPEIAAFLVPEAAYIRPDRDAGGPQRLSFFFLETDLADRDALRQRIRASISIWLGIVYPKKPAEMRNDIAKAVEDDSNWTCIPVKTGMRIHEGTCAAPLDNRFFDTLTAYVVRHLAGKPVQFGAGQDRTMVLQTPHSSLFGGIELVAFPPNRGRDGTGLWSEVVTVSTATFPERKDKGIHVLVRPSIRNWGPIRGYDTWTSPTRSLDVFTPPDGHVGNDGFGHYRHASFRYKAKVENWSDVIQRKAEKNVVARWESQEDHRVFDLVGRLAGANRLANADLTQPIVGEEGRWVLPRLAPGSGDRFLSGASGVGWQDRQDIAFAIGKHLEPAGFARSEPMTRLPGKMPIKGPFKNVPAVHRDQTNAARRDALMKVLAAIDGRDGGLDIVVFRIQDDTPQALAREIRNYLGAPDREENTALVWNDGLRINVIPAVSGPLAEALPRLQLDESETIGKTDRQQMEIRRAKQDEAKQQVADNMRRHIRATRGGRTGIACAILEMPASHLKGGDTDPYAIARSELASERLLPQVVLVEDEDKQDGENVKLRAALRDLFRMLGVLPVFEDRLPYGVAAIGVIQRNAQVVGGGRIQSQAFPLAVRTKDGILECALPQENGEPHWLPYAEAALFIFSGINEKFRRTRMDENATKFHTFFNSVLEQVNRAGGAVVLADMETLADKWIPSIQNGRLAFDRIEIGTRVYGPTDLPNIRVIRHSAASNKMPSYFVEDETQWPTGIFIWGENAQRTGYALKRKPVSAKTLGRAMLTSRHLSAGDNRAIDDRPRKVSAVDEVCVVFCQRGDDLTDLRLIAHRLRSVHAQYEDDTISPFPLHELLLLGKAVTS
jgi:hypothetical protein